MAKKPEYDVFPVGDTPPYRYAVVHIPTGEWVGDLHWDRYSAESFIRNQTAKDEAEVELEDMGIHHRPPEPVQDPNRRNANAVVPTQARR